MSSESPFRQRVIIERVKAEQVEVEVVQSQSQLIPVEGLLGKWVEGGWVRRFGWCALVFNRVRLRFVIKGVETGGGGGVSGSEAKV